LEALTDLQRLARSEQLFDPRGEFLELLFAVRYETLTSTQASPSAAADRRS